MKRFLLLYIEINEFKVFKEPFRCFQVHINAYTYIYHTYVCMYKILTTGFVDLVKPTGQSESEFQINT